jgi:beta-phosphoglucomutase
VGCGGAIFDVDGVLVAPDRARRETRQLLMETNWRDTQPRTTYAPERFAPAVYQEVVAGKPRLSGARAALDALAEGRLERRSR